MTRKPPPVRGTIETPDGVLTWEQLDLGDALKDAGQALAVDGAPAWSAAAAAWVRDLRPGKRFTSEDLTRAVGLPRGDHALHRNNAVGAVIGGCARRGLIVRTGAFVKSQAPSSHAHLCAIWARTDRETE